MGWVTVEAPPGPEGEGLELHWAVTRAGSGDEWLPPPAEMREGASPGTRDFGDGKALRTPFPPEAAPGGGARAVRIPVPSALVGDRGPGGGGAAAEGGGGEAHVEDDFVESVVAVLVRAGGDGGGDDEWLHAENGGDMRVAVGEPSGSSGAAGAPLRNIVLDRAVASEKGREMGLFRRFQLAREALGDAKALGPRGAGALLAWMRLSSTRQLPWYSGGNYQGKDMASLQEGLARSVASLVADPELDPASRQYFRLVMSGLPRGGGDGDAIRMGILNIMREHGIKEGHRPGIEDRFIAQWHQKLHSNTTVDDVAICEAYLHFLHTGQWDDFWSHLWGAHGLSREDLAAMRVGWRNEEGITGPATHLPQLIPAFQGFLNTLKVTHQGADLDNCLHNARWRLSGDLQWALDDLLSQRDAWWVPGKLAEIRGSLAPQLAPGSDDADRDVLLLDIALESFLRTKVEALDLGAMADGDVASVLELALRSAALSDARFGPASRLWSRVLAEGDPAWTAGRADAALDHVAAVLGSVMDNLAEAVTPAGEAIGRVANIPEAALLNFGEEAVRGHPAAALSPLLARLRPAARQAAGRSAWDVVARPPGGEARGTVVLADLADLQGEDFSDDAAGGVIVLSARLGGLEDVPPGVVAVLTPEPVDVLSHCGLRARQAGALLASCADAAAWSSLCAEPLPAAARVSCGERGDVDFQPCEVGTRGGGPAARGGAAPAGNTAPLAPAAPALPAGGTAKRDPWLLKIDAYVPGRVGGKSLGLAALATLATDADADASLNGEVGGSVCVPPSVALPFGAFERAIATDSFVTADLEAALEGAASAQAAGDKQGLSEALSAARTAVEALEVPEELKAELVPAAAEIFRAFSDEEEGLAASLDADGAASDLVDAVRTVWASQWTERAYLSRRALGWAEGDLRMAALVMPLVPAEYAFVLHTRDPLTGDAGRVFGEVCVGLGEALVGNEPGRAFSFSFDKGSGEAEVLALPSKPWAHSPAGAGTFIARSDSNGEDLEGFAGAGLYDSVVAGPEAPRRLVEYADEPLFWDPAFQVAIAARLGRLGAALEDAAGSAQDVEGALRGGRTYLLQSRPQILASP